DHGHFDQISRRALHRRIDGGSFGSSQTRPLGATYLRQPKPSAKYSLYIALFARLAPGFVHIDSYAGITRKVPIDIGLGGVPGYAQAGGQAKLAHAVDQAEVNGFGGPPLF